jgi:ATP/maltotriose-dependent transcriptional regulator MalT/DNA-binding SARP family transcriptional activator
MVSPAATSSKLLVPRVPADAVARPRLLDALRDVTSRRLTTVVAGTGYGKSTLVAAWAVDQPVAWYTVDRADRDPRVLAAGLTMALRVRTPGLNVDPAVLSGGSPSDDTHAAGLAGFLAESLSEELRTDVALVVDDADELEGSPSAALLAALCRHAPPALHLVLLLQGETPFPIARMRAQGQVLEVGGGDLAFTPEETEALLAAAMPDAPVRELARSVYAVTSGWPAAVRMAAVTLEGRPAEHRRAALDRLSRRGSPLAELLAEEVFQSLEPGETELVRAASSLDRFSVELLDAMGVPATDSVPRLARSAVVIHEEAEPGWFAVPPVVRAYVVDHLGVDLGDGAARAARGAAWLERRNAHREALDLLLAVGDDTAVADYVARNGRALVASGAASEVLRAIDGLSPDRRPTLIAPEIEARFASGDWDGVAAAVGRFPPGDLPPIVALRAGLVLYLRGRIHDAVDTYDRAAAPADEAERAVLATIRAYRAAAHWLLGEADECREVAISAMALARDCADDAALAAAHTVAAMLAAFDGDRATNQVHYVRALAHAEAAGDVLQIIRIRTNRGSRANEEGSYDEALVELDLAVDLAERSGYQSFAALALSNRGEAHLRLGRLDEAARDLQGAVARYALLGSRMRNYPLSHLGELHRLRGERAQARAAFEASLRLAEESSDQQGLVPSLVGLAELLLEDDPGAATKHAMRALAVEPSLHRAKALWVGAQLALGRGDIDEAERMIDDLAAIGSERRDRTATACALELRARVTVAADARALLGEALEMWRAMREPAGEARVLVALAGVSDAASAVPLLGTARDIVHRLGARSLLDAIDEQTRRLERAESVAVRIVTLGGFRVYLSGEPIPPSAWQSRKARDLLKLLVSRMGRPLPREQLCEMLWPDEPAARRSSRLSVTLSTVRSVLDPAKAHEADAFVAADRDNVWLDLEAVDIDIRRFVGAAERALAPERPSVEALAGAETLYAGEFLDDDPYADWAVALREEARALYLRVAQRLAEALDAAGELDRAGHLYLRLLQRDPYDEAVHLALVRVLDRAGHRGEARRAYRSYSARMAELDVEPAAYPT